MLFVHKITSMESIVLQFKIQILHHKWVPWPLHELKITEDQAYGIHFWPILTYLNHLERDYFLMYMELTFEPGVSK